jgi:hypothetical protein
MNAWFHASYPVHSISFFKENAYAMAHEKSPVTPAVRMLHERNVEYTEDLYDYVEKGGTAVSSRALGVDEHDVIKTLIMEDDRKNPLAVLMHGDCEVSTKAFYEFKRWFLV